MSVDQTAIEFVSSRGIDVSTPKSSESGLWWVDIEEGTGHAATPKSRVKVHYSGWLTNGSKFDSSRDRGQPISFRLSEVIPGWTEGVGSMRVGGTRYLVIPPRLGYGDMGAPPDIPPRSTLVFEVELLAVD